MARLEIRRILKDQVFYEVDHQVAVKWTALETAKQRRPGIWSVRARRSNGTELEFSVDEERNREMGKFLALHDFIHEPSFKML